MADTATLLRGLHPRGGSPCPSSLPRPDSASSDRSRCWPTAGRSRWAARSSGRCSRCCCWRRTAWSRSSAWSATCGGRTRRPPHGPCCTAASPGCAGSCRPVRTGRGCSPGRRGTCCGSLPASWTSIRSEELAAQDAGPAPDPATAAAALRSALELWRGPALQDLPLDCCRLAATRLDERRLAVLERRVDLDLKLGRFGELAAELAVLVQEHPLRERLWAQLMLALYGSARQADALAAFRRLRATLVEQLGIEPSALPRQVERAVLAGQDALPAYWRAIGDPVPRPPATPPERTRRRCPAPALSRRSCRRRSRRSPAGPGPRPARPAALRRRCRRPARRRGDRRYRRRRQDRARRALGAPGRATGSRTASCT